MPIPSLQTLAAAVVVEHASEFGESFQDVLACEPLRAVLLEGARMTYDALPLHILGRKSPRLRFLEKHTWFWIEPRVLVTAARGWEFYPSHELLLERIPTHVDMTPVLTHWATQTRAWLSHPCRVFDAKRVVDYILTARTLYWDLKACMENLGPSAFMDATTETLSCEEILLVLFNPSFTQDPRVWREEAAARGWDDFVARFDAEKASATR